MITSRAAVTALAVDNTTVIVVTERHTVQLSGQHFSQHHSSHKRAQAKDCPPVTEVLKQTLGHEAEALGMHQLLFRVYDLRR